MDTFLSLASEGAQGILDACSSSLHKPGRRGSVSGAPPSSLDRIIKDLCVSTLDAAASAAGSSPHAPRSSQRSGTRTPGGDAAPAPKPSPGRTHGRMRSRTEIEEPGLGLPVTLSRLDASSVTAAEYRAPPTQPITAVTLLAKGDAVPPGFTKLDVSCHLRKPISFRSPALGRSVSLAVQRGKGAAVTSAAIILADRGESVPPGHFVVKTHSTSAFPNLAADLSTVSGHEAYLCVTKDPGAPITDLEVSIPSLDEHPPTDFLSISQSVLGFDCALQPGSGSKALRLHVRKDLSHISACRLRPLSPSRTVANASTSAGANLAKLSRTPELRHSANAAPAGHKDVSGIGHSRSTTDLNTSHRQVHSRLDRDARPPQQPPGSSDREPPPRTRTRGQSVVIGFSMAAFQSTPPLSTSGAKHNHTTTAASLHQALPSVGDVGSEVGSRLSTQTVVETEHETDSDTPPAAESPPPAHSRDHPSGGAGAGAGAGSNGASATDHANGSGDGDGDGSGGGGGDGGDGGGSTSTPDRRGKSSGRRKRKAKHWWQTGSFPPVVPSPVSNLLLPFLYGCYSPNKDVVAAAIAGIEVLVTKGLAHQDSGFLAQQEFDTGQDRAGVRASLCSLLDFAVMCVVDGSRRLIDRISDRTGLLFVAALRSELHIHPTTLYRVFEVAISANVFFQQKKAQAERRLRSSRPSAALQGECQLMLAGARRQLKSTRTVLGALVRTAAEAAVEESRRLHTAYSPGKNPNSPSSPAFPLAAAKGAADPSPRSRTDSDSSDGSPSAAVRAGSAVSVALASSLVGDLVEWVVAAGTMERCVTTFHKHPVVSPRFCVDMDASATTMLPSTASQSGIPTRAKDMFIVLAMLCKLARAPLRCHPDGSPVRPSEFHLKVLCLHLLVETLDLTGDHFVRDGNIIAFAVRRLACPAILDNHSGGAVRLPVVFRATMDAFTMLWNNYRFALKVELAVLFNTLIRILNSPHSKPAQKVDVLTHLEEWLKMPQNLVEMYLNFDNDSPVQHLRIFDKLFTALCTLAAVKRPRGVSSDTDSEAEDDSAAVFVLDHEQLRLKQQALASVEALMRSLMDASATAHFIRMGDARTRRLSKPTWEAEDLRKTFGSSLAAVTEERGTISDSSDEDADAVDVDTLAEASVDPPVAAGATAPDASGGGKVEEPEPASGDVRRSSVRLRHAQQQRNQAVLEKALVIAKEKSLKKCITYLIVSDYIKNTGHDIAAFLRVHGDKIDDRALGDYLGEGGGTPQEVIMYHHIREEYIGGISFAGMSVDEAMRYLLTKAGFFLPGEAQKIDRITTAFARAYYRENPSLFSSSETIEVLAFSIIMLNTDAFNQSIRKQDRMSKEAFVRNNRGIDQGKDLPRDMLESIYDNIVTNEIKMGLTNSTQTKQRWLGRKDRTRRVDEYIQEMSSGVARAQALLNAHACLRRSYYSKISVDVVRLMLDDVWAEALRLIKTELESRDVVLIRSSLTLLRDAVSTCLFCGAIDERRAFSEVLARLTFKLEQDPSLVFRKHVDPAASSRALREERSRHQKLDLRILHGEHRAVPWFRQVMDANRYGPSSDVTDAIREVHMAVTRAMEQLSNDAAKQDLDYAAKRFTTKLRRDLEADPSRRLLHEGDLVKVCSGGTGKLKTYRFFLFSDMLVYASRAAFSHKYSARRKLPLASLEVVFDPEQLADMGNGFVVKNNQKDLYLVANSHAERVTWRRVIAHAQSEAGVGLAFADNRSTHSDAATDGGGSESQGGDTYGDRSDSGTDGSVGRGGGVGVSAGPGRTAVARQPSPQRTPRTSQRARHSDAVVSGVVSPASSDAAGDSSPNGEADGGDDNEDGDGDDGSRNGNDNGTSPGPGSRPSPRRRRSRHGSTSSTERDGLPLRRAYASDSSMADSTVSVHIPGEDDNAGSLWGHHDDDASQDSAERSTQVFVRFLSAPLGFSVKKRGRGLPGARVHSVAPMDGPHRLLRPFDVVSFVDGQDVSSLPYAEVKAMVQSAGMAMRARERQSVVIGFLRPSGDATNGAMDTPTPAAGTSSSPSSPAACDGAPAASTAASDGDHGGIADGAGGSSSHDGSPAGSRGNPCVATPREASVPATPPPVPRDTAPAPPAVPSPAGSRSADHASSPPTREAPGVSSALSPTEGGGSPASSSVSSGSPLKRQDSLANVKRRFIRALAVARPLLQVTPAGGVHSSSATVLSDDDKLAFYGFFKQATVGDCPAEGAVADGGADDDDDGGAAAAKLEVWRSCHGMRRRDAMRKFVKLLTEVHPQWEASPDHQEPPAAGTE